MEKHVEELQKSTFHKNGACVTRHESNLKPGCKYWKNGFMITRKARAARYSSPARFDARNADYVAQAMRKVAGKVVASPYQQDPERKQKTVSDWNVGVSLTEAGTGTKLPENFKPREMGGVGFHHPYLHNWHHMIGNAMLVKHLVLEGKPNPYVLLEVLMAGKYNINGPRNVVLLPQQRIVGRIIKWPIHPNNHPRFDVFAEQQLGTLKNRLRQALDDAKHPVKNKATTDIANDLNNVSDELLNILDQMGLMENGGGMHINRIGEAAARLAARAGGAA